MTSASQRQRSTAELHPGTGQGCPPTMIYDVAQGILCLMQRSLLHPVGRLGIEPKLQLRYPRVLTTGLPTYRWSKCDTPQGCNSNLPSITQSASTDA